jgi:hypothetical protein
MPQSIDALYAWVATNPDGNEGVCSMQLGAVHMPLIGADMDRVKSLRGAIRPVLYRREHTHARRAGLKGELPTAHLLAEALFG